MYAIETKALVKRYGGVTAVDGLELQIHGGELFSLRLSFFWWAILSLLVLPMLYTVPYYCASVAIYARYRMEYRRRADEEPPAPPSEWMEKPADPAGELSAADDKTQEYPVSEVRAHLEEEKA